MINHPIKHSDAFVETKIGDELIVMHLESGEFFSLRGTAAEIWELADGGRSTDQIVEELAARHDAPADAVREDVQEFLDQLGQAGLVAESE